MLSKEEVVGVEVLDDTVEIKFGNTVNLDKPESVYLLEGALLAGLAVLL